MCAELACCAVGGGQPSTATMRRVCSGVQGQGKQPQSSSFFCSLLQGQAVQGTGPLAAHLQAAAARTHTCQRTEQAAAPGRPSWAALHCAKDAPHQQQLPAVPVSSRACPTLTPSCLPTVRKSTRPSSPPSPRPLVLTPPRSLRSRSKRRRSTSTRLLGCRRDRMSCAASSAAACSAACSTGSACGKRMSREEPQQQPGTPVTAQTLQRPRERCHNATRANVALPRWQSKGLFDPLADRLFRCPVAAHPRYRRQFVKARLRPLPIFCRAAVGKRREHNEGGRRGELLVPCGSRKPLLRKLLSHPQLAIPGCFATHDPPRPLLLCLQIRRGLRGVEHRLQRSMAWQASFQSWHAQAELQRFLSPAAAHAADAHRCHLHHIAHAHLLR